MADWQPGDLALCIKKPDGDFDTGWTVQPGGVYTVMEFDFWWDGEPFLNFFEDPFYVKDAGFEACAFVKVTPGTEIDGFEEPRRVPQTQDA